MFEQNQNLSSNQTSATQVPSVAPVTENTVSFEQVATSQPKRKWWLIILISVFGILIIGGGAYAFLFTDLKNKLPFFNKPVENTNEVVNTEPVINNEVSTSTIDLNLDTDVDGLRDTDEINIWKTDINSADSDGDTYSDGDEVKNGYNPVGEGKLDEKDLFKNPEAVFMGYIKAGQKHDLQTMANFIYSGDVFLSNTQELKTSLGLLTDVNIKNTPEKFRWTTDFDKIVFGLIDNLQYTIDSVNIQSDQAILKISAIINGRQKKPTDIYLVKDSENWKINLFKYTHTPDGTVDSITSCDNLCEAKGLWASSNLLNKNTNACYCYYEKPSASGLAYLNDECEAKSGSYRGPCYMSYAEGIKDENYCQRAVGLQDLCFESLAKIKNDSNICDNLWEDRKCLANF